MLTLTTTSSGWGISLRDGRPMVQMSAFYSPLMSSSRALNDIRGLSNSWAWRAPALLQALLDAIQRHGPDHVRSQIPSMAHHCPRPP